MLCQRLWRIQDFSQRADNSTVGKGREREWGMGSGWQSIFHFFYWKELTRFALQINLFLNKIHFLNTLSYFNGYIPDYKNLKLVINAHTSTQIQKKKTTHNNVPWFFCHFTFKQRFFYELKKCSAAWNSIFSQSLHASHGIILSKHKHTEQINILYSLQEESAVNLETSNERRTLISPMTSCFSHS